MVPFMLAFAAIAYAKIPDRLDGEAGHGRLPPLPLLRLATLAAGVCCVAATGPIDNGVLRAILIIAAGALVALTFRLDRFTPNNLFPPEALSLTAPIGLALWILALHGMTQTSVSLFLPLLLQVVHGVSPLFVNFLSIIISIGWTIGTFSVSGWSGLRERLALLSGPLIAFLGLVAMTAIALLPGLALLALCPRHGARHRHLQCPPRRPRDGQRRPRRAAQHCGGIDLGALDRHRLRRRDRRCCRQHGRPRRRDRAGGGRPRGDRRLPVLLGSVRAGCGLYAALRPGRAAAERPGRRDRRLRWVMHGGIGIDEKEDGQKNRPSVCCICLFGGRVVLPGGYGRAARRHPRRSRQLDEGIQFARR
jgi:hypothetical protein